jgi:hypothetical protein
MSSCDFTLKIPESNPNERAWIADTILSRISDSYNIEFYGGSNWELTLTDINYRIIFNDDLMSRDLFSNPDLIIPSTPLEKLTIIKSGLEKYIGLPIISGKNNLIENVDSIYVGLDIFGSAFLMLSMYEEYFSKNKDNHGRVGADGLMIVKANLAERPIIDEYVEFLIDLIKIIHNRVRINRTLFETVLSHDVDNPSRYDFLSLPKTIKSVVADIMLNHRPIRGIKGGINFLHNNENYKFKDEFNNFDWIMQQSEFFNVKSTFNFIAGKSEKEYDPHYSMDSIIIRDLLRRIHERGHVIGLHPSYRAYCNYEIFSNEFLNLKNILAEERIEQALSDSRMHYLRWSFPHTLQICEKVGIKYENSLGFSDRAGFRCGTAVEFPAYDLQNRKKLSLIIRPLIAMECSIISDKYMGLGLSSESFDHFYKLKKLCQKFGGKFTLLWHNTELINEDQKEFYVQLLKA